MNTLYTKIYNYLEKVGFYTPSQLAQFTKVYTGLFTELNKEKIYSDLVMIGLLATIRTEVGRDFLPISEFGGYSYFNQYDFRKSLGNDVKGDGYTYRGRGYIQLTGKANYKKYGDLLGIDLIRIPSLALNSNVAISVSIKYFFVNKIISKCNNKDWKGVRIAVNGGLNGWADFSSVVNQFLGLL